MNIIVLRFAHEFARQVLSVHQRLQFLLQQSTNKVTISVPCIINIIYVFFRIYLLLIFSFVHNKLQELSCFFFDGELLGTRKKILLGQDDGSFVMSLILVLVFSF